MFQRILEVLAEFDHFSAQTTHRGILLPTVAVGNDDHRPQTSTHAGEGHALAKVTTRSCDYSFHLGMFPRKLSDVEPCDPAFECANRWMVLVLHPHAGCQ